MVMHLYHHQPRYAQLCILIASLDVTAEFLHLHIDAAFPKCDARLDEPGEDWQTPQQ